MIDMISQQIRVQFSQTNESRIDALTCDRNAPCFGNFTGLSAE